MLGVGRAGYATAHYGKWHIQGGGPEAHGYDESDGDTGNADAEPFVDPKPVDIFGMGERAMALMDGSKNANKPFFIQLSYYALHYPGNARKATLAKYQDRLAGNREKEVGRAALAEDLDSGIGLLLAKVDELGLRDNTYLIYMSDNGGGSRGIMSGGKGSIHEGGIPVPLIIAGPGIAPGSWSRQRVVGFDLLPTFCELAGVRGLPAGIEGGSFTHLLRGGERPSHGRANSSFTFPTTRARTARAPPFTMAITSSSTSMRPDATPCITWPPTSLNGVIWRRSSPSVASNSQAVCTAT